jgi:hypothetical protein
MRPSELLPLGARLAKTLKGAMDHYASLSAVSPSMRRPAVVLWVNAQLEEWNPMVRGITVLDPLSRAAAAEFLGGVAFNVAEEMNKRGAA